MLRFSFNIKKLKYRFNRKYSKNESRVNVEGNMFVGWLTDMENRKQNSRIL